MSSFTNTLGKIGDFASLIPGITGAIGGLVNVISGGGKQEGVGLDSYNSAYIQQQQQQLQQEQQKQKNNLMIFGLFGLFFTVVVVVVSLIFKRR